MFYLVHGLAQRPAPGASDASRTVANLSVPPDIARMQGRARVDALRPVLEQLHVRGEVDFVRHVASEHRLIVPVRLPDGDTIVSLDCDKRTATVTSEAFEAIEVAGTPVKAFAEQNGLSSSNAGVRVFRAREALKKRVTESCGTCADYGCLNCTCTRA